LRALCAELPRSWAEWSEPTGGYLIWLRLRSTQQVAVTSDWLARFAAAGVEVTPGEGFFPPGTAPIDACCFRLSISRLDEDEIVEGVRRLGRAVRQVYGEEENQP
jgi:DNA-binding transcriptional MocR family regulator